MLKVVDLSHTIHTEMPVFPGDRQPLLENMAMLERNGFRETWLQLTSHTGTHIDAPSHLLKEGKSLSDFSLSQFYGKAYIADVANIHGDIKPNHLPEEILEKGSVDFILLHTGMERSWGSARYFSKFSVISSELARILAELHLKGVGADCISLDPVDSKELYNHRILLQADIILIENLRNLKPYCNRYLTFSCFPLNIDKGDGSPVRAVGYLEI